MKFTPEQLAEWKALVTKLIDDSSDHMGVAHSTDMPPQHTVNFRHAKNAHEAAWAITNLIADLEEAQKDLENERARGIHSCHDNCTQDGCVNRRLRDELAATRKQLAEALAKIAAVRKLCAGDRAPNWTNDASVYSTRGYILDLTECEMSALQSAIAEAVEPYRKDAACWQFARKELCWREEGEKQIRWTMILRMPKPNTGIEVLREGSIAKELDAAVLAAIAAKGETE